jgi:hypothetical protein
VVLPLISWFDMLHKAYLSQKQHSLIVRCDPPFEVCEGFSYQHELAYDATTNPC